MDSDAVIDKQFADTPLANMIGTMQAKLDWDPKKKPIVFNQDGPCWWCRLVKNVGYDMCLNAGTVFYSFYSINVCILLMNVFNLNSIKELLLGIAMN